MIFLHSTRLQIARTGGHWLANLLVPVLHKNKAQNCGPEESHASERCMKIRASHMFGNDRQSKGQSEQSLLAKISKLKTKHKTAVWKNRMQVRLCQRSTKLYAMHLFGDDRKSRAEAGGRLMTKLLCTDPAQDQSSKQRSGRLASK